MKKLITLLVFAAISAMIMAQAPEKMSYQSVIRNSGGELLANSNVGIKISILKDSSEGDAVYVETHIAQTNANGLVTLLIGGGSVVVGTFEGIDWSSGQYFLKTETDPTGSINYSISGTSQLLSVPYAMYSNSSGRTTNHYIGELYGGGIIFWVSPDGQSGLVMSLEDIGTAPWSNVSTAEVGAYSHYDGLGNTIAIVNQSGHTISAAKLCLDYSYEGFNDWYLPSFWQLLMIYNSVYTINHVLINDGNPLSQPISSLQNEDAQYWSSTENYIGNALKLGISKSYTSSEEETKTIVLRVRGIRSF